MNKDVREKVGKDFSIHLGPNGPAHQARPLLGAQTHPEVKT